MRKLAVMIISLLVTAALVIGISPAQADPVEPADAGDKAVSKAHSVESTAVAAKRSGYSQRHIRRLIMEGKVKGRRNGPRNWRVCPRSLEEYRSQEDGAC